MIADSPGNYVSGLRQLKVDDPQKRWDTVDMIWYEDKEMLCHF